MRRSLEPGMRYPCSAPESNHLLTVRGATLQILATSPVVKTSLTLLVVELLLMAFSPVGPRGFRRRGGPSGASGRLQRFRPLPPVQPPVSSVPSGRSVAVTPSISTPTVIT